MNEITIVGNLGQDPEMRQAGNIPVCNLSIATSHRKGQGQNVEWVSTWHRVTVWGHQANLCAQSMKKGMKVFIVGRWEQQEWNDKNTGEKKTGTNIQASEVGIAFPKTQPQPQQQNQAYQQPMQQSNQPPQPQYAPPQQQPQIPQQNQGGFDPNNIPF